MLNVSIRHLVNRQLGQILERLRGNWLIDASPQSRVIHVALTSRIGLAGDLDYGTPACFSLNPHRLNIDDYTIEEVDSCLI